MNVTVLPAETTPTQTHPLWGSRAVKLAWAGVALVTLFHLWYMCQVDLVADEAYYWVWSKFFAFSYRDKGPLVAWVIAGGTHLFGDTVFGVRFFAVLLSVGTAFQLFQLARRLYDERTALWCLAIALVLPLFAIGSILMTIDPLSVFFWAWGANLAWRGFETGKYRYWLVLGLVIGIGFLAKFINAMQLLCVAIFLGWSKPHRHFLVSKQSVLMVLGFAVTSFPLFLWNAQTGWLHIRALHERSGLHSSFGIHPVQFLRYLGAELGVISPLFLIGIVVAVVGLWRTQSDQPRVKHLLSQFLPIQIMYLILSFNGLVEPNWIAPTLITGIVMLVVFWRQVIAKSPKWRWAPVWGLGVAFVITLYLHCAVFIRPPLPMKYDLLGRGEGWADFGQHVQQLRGRFRPNLLIANHYSPASQLQFYLPDHPFIYLPPAPYGTTQYTLWPGYEVKPGTRALYVCDGKGLLPDKVKDAFDDSQLVDDFWTDHKGRQTARFHVYLLTKN
jgi:4-amino-4-deoxy-L-arabinose transferase-like glycosyltransferase